MLRKLLLKIVFLSISCFELSHGGAAEDQLVNYKAKHSDPGLATDQKGFPVPSLTASQTLGKSGPILLQDTNFLDFMGHFDRERIPERVVHAKGTGAFGEFEVTADITKYCKAKVFDKIGKKTPVLVRFSTVGGEKGTADTVNDPRGFAVKFYTEEGNWDLTGNNIINFAVRDPILFPSFVHSRKRNPETNLFDPNTFWDFVTLRQESVLHTMFQFAGIPATVREMDGFGGHTFKMVNDKNEAVYVKFHWTSNQGVKYMDWNKAGIVAGSDPDHYIRDLYNAIARGEYPSWKLSIQTMTFAQAETYKWNPFDLTKLWPITDVGEVKGIPLIEVGKMTLNRNVKNFFDELEQAAFHPGNLIPGIEVSPDRMLIGRIFSYSDSQMHRLGPNFLEIPVNRPDPAVKVRTYMREGRAVYFSQGGAPNYFPNSFSGPEMNPRGNQSVYTEKGGDVVRYDTGEDDNYSLATWHFNDIMTKEERTSMSCNIASHLKGAADFLQKKALEMYGKVSPDFEKMIAEKMKDPKMGIGNYTDMGMACGIPDHVTDPDPGHSTDPGQGTDPGNGLDPGQGTDPGGYRNGSRLSIGFFYLPQ